MAFFAPKSTLANKTADKAADKTADKTATKIASQTPKASAQKIQVPSYMKRGAVFYHATKNTDADKIVAEGINPKIQGNVNALGRGFYTVQELRNVWQWMHPDETSLEKLETDQERKKYLSEQHSVVMIEIVTVPTEVYNGWSEEAQVIVGSGDIVWTESGIKLVKVIGQINGKVMRSNLDFQAWYEEHYKVNK